MRKICRSFELNAQVIDMDLLVFCAVLLRPLYYHNADISARDEAKIFHE